MEIRRATLALALASGCFDPAALVPPTVDEDEGLPSLELNGSRFHLETFGKPTDRVVIFLHGGPGLGDYRAWLRHTHLAEAGLFLVMWDQRGAGLSRRHPAKDISLAAYTEDLHALVQHFAPDGRKVALVGHSWGGQYAVHYTSRYPERVDRLVLSEPGPFTAALFAEKAPQIFALDPTSQSANRRLWSENHLTPDDMARADYRAAQVLSEGTIAGYHFSQKDVMPFWRMGTTASAAILAEAVNEKGAFDFDFTVGLNAFNGPTLFLRGALNEIFDDSYYARQMQPFPGARLETLEGVGHDLLWVTAERHSALVAAHLAR